MTTPLSPLPVRLPDGCPTATRERLAAALHAVRAVAAETLRHFGDPGLEVRAKADASPVSAADIAAEGILRASLLAAFPDDAFLGEETGATPGTSGYEWVVDPIDGTKSFIRGVPLWATLVGCRTAGRGVVGVIAIPALGETVWAAEGSGAWHEHGSAPPRRARVSDRPTLGGALLCTSDFTSFARRPAGLGGAAAGDAARRALEGACGVCRTWGDGYGYLLVATGRAELMVDPLMNAWDAAAVETVVAEAGGVFSDWSGTARIDGGDGIASNGRVHAAAVEILRRARGGA